MNYETLRNVTLYVLEAIALVLVFATLGRSQSFSEIWEQSKFTSTSHRNELRAESNSKQIGQYSQIANIRE